MPSKNSSSPANIERRIKYYEGVRDYAKELVEKTERDLAGIEASAPGLKRDFKHYRNKGRTLLDSIDAKIERERKKLNEAKRT